MGRAAHLSVAQAPCIANPAGDPVGHLVGSGVDDRQRIAGSHLRADRRLDDQPGGRIDPILLADPPRAKLERGEPDLQRIDRFHMTAGLRLDRNLDRSHRQASLQAATLRREHALEGLPPGAGPQHFLRIRRHPCEPAHLAGHPQAHLEQLGVPVAGQGVERLLNLERVTHGAAQRVVHRGHERHSAATSAFAELHHLGGELLRRCHVGHERSAPELDVEHDGVGARSDLFRHHAGRDQRHRRHGRRDVAQGVKELVRRHHERRLRGNCDPDVADLPDEALGLQVDRQPGNRLQLVQGPTGVGERPAAQLRHLDPACSGERCRDQRHLIADTARRMFVDLDPRDRAEVEHLAAGDHRLCERERLGGRHAADADGHQPGSHLVVGDLAS